MFRQCVADGGDEESCLTAARAAAEACIAENCLSEGPGCAERCASSAAELKQACIDAGVDPELCAARAETMARHCIDEHCDDTEPPAPSCEERCEDHSQHELRRCLAEGGTEDDCATRAREQFQGCVALHCQTPPSCEAACDRRAERLKRRCLKRGGSEEQCTAKAEEASAACKAKRCAPPPPDTCGTECEDEADDLGTDCANDDTEAETCEALEQGALDECVDSCGAAPDPTCAEDCEESVQERFAALTGGKGSARVKLKARKAFKRCMRDCESDG
jgi:hypothetical protein